ncbi:MAG: FkbM family methyltransferase [Deltaproteobacteria bacterium]|nr:FkbM family methyltransferase [Deltaproteobacteria bacterium]
MKETLSNFEDKVEIIPKWVGDKDEKNCITLDKYFEGSYDKVDYIQADIEGAEMKMLWGAEELVKTSSMLKLSVCCYHNSYDEAEIGDFLRARGFAVRPSKGYMLLFMQYPLKYPYVRRGVLYASKPGLEV